MKEIERKFLVNLPKSWSDLSELFDSLLDIKRISQTYLNKKEDEQQSARIRKTIEGFNDKTKTLYDINQKKYLEKGVSQEFEKQISKAEYENLFKNKDPEIATLNKTRYVFDFNDQIFELDVFKGPLQGLAILEIELKNIKDLVSIPTYLNIIEEVTGDKRFNNFSLAKKDLLEKLV